MTLDSCKRIMWRLQEKGSLDSFKLHTLEWAIMEECGVDPRTVKKYIKVLLKIGWISHSDELATFTATEKGKIT